MPFTGLSPEDLLAGSTRVIEMGLEGAKIFAAHSMPALQHSANLGAEAIAWSTQNPTLAACTFVGTTGATILALPGLATAPLLWGIGTLGSVQGGSLFAAAQSSMGYIVAGSPMAIVQSAGAGGSGLVVVNGVAQLGGAVMTAGSAALAWITAR